MEYEWILDVLTDLKAFASENDLGALAEHLEDTTLVAAAEIARKTQQGYTTVNGSQAESGFDNRRIGRY